MTENEQANERAERQREYNDRVLSEALAAEAHATDALLAVLRKHNVAEYAKDQFGLRIKLHEQAPSRFNLGVYGDPGAPLRQHLASTTDNGPQSDANRAAVAEPPPEPGVVEPVRFDVNDVLYGAK